MNPGRRSGDARGGSRLGLWLGGCAALYAIAYGVSFMGDPLGRQPVLDGRENLAWAEAIAAERLPAEPLYRALLYPWVLSHFTELGGNLPRLATALGIVCHLANAGLCALLAGRLWRAPQAGLAGGLLYACYPVALFFAGQMLDVTFAMTLFLAGTTAVLFAVPAEGKVPGSRACAPWCLLVAGLLGGLAVTARPNFLPALLVLPVAFALAHRLRQGRWGGGAVAFLAVGALLPLLGQGWVNLNLSGHWTLLPWQGSYNLYAANREGTDGAFHRQQVSFDTIPEGMNPSRLESEYLYRQAKGEDAPLDIGGMRQYWREKTFERISGDPLGWLGLMVGKALYLLNDWEQYNNLTYAYHKDRFPLLAWNPLGWGVLLSLAGLALVLGRNRIGRAEAAVLLPLALAYAAGVLLFFVSARFRLPLAPLLCVCCGGLLVVPWRSLASREWKRGALCVGLLALLAFGNWLGAGDRATFRQDRLLLAKASLESGSDAAAARLAAEALAADPDLEAAKRIRVAALFNRWLEQGGGNESTVWADLGAAIQAVERPDASGHFIEGLYRWREGRRRDARTVWAAAVARYGEEAVSSARALEWVDADPARAVSETARAIGQLLNRGVEPSASATDD